MSVEFKDTDAGRANMHTLSLMMEIVASAEWLVGFSRSPMVYHQLARTSVGFVRAQEFFDGAMLRLKRTKPELAEAFRTKWRDVAAGLVYPGHGPLEISLPERDTAKVAAMAAHARWRKDIGILA